MPQFCIFQYLLKCIDISGDKYHITQQHDPHFLTLTVVKWIDLFTRPEYRYIITNSLNYCIQNKGLTVYSWVIMSNHIHLILQTQSPNKLSDVLRDFKRYTSVQIIKSMKMIPESRREWLMDQFFFEARRTGRAKNFKIWKDDNHAIWLGDIDIWEKIYYIHENPVKSKIVTLSENYLFSSAMDYAGNKGLANVTVLN